MTKSKEFIELERQYQTINQIENEIESLKYSINNIGNSKQYLNTFQLDKDDLNVLLELRMKKLNFISNTPIAVEISSWQPYKEIIYKCPKCMTEFRYFGSKEKFCHNCGLKINWNVLLELSEPFDKNNYEYEKLFISELNNKQRLIGE